MHECTRVRIVMIAIGLKIVQRAYMDSGLRVLCVPSYGTVARRAGQLEAEEVNRDSYILITTVVPMKKTLAAGNLIVSRNKSKEQIYLEDVSSKLVANIVFYGISHQ